MLPIVVVYLHRFRKVGIQAEIRRKYDFKLLEQVQIIKRSVPYTPELIIIEEKVDILLSFERKANRIKPFS